MIKQCKVGASMADDYFQHAAECPECSALAPQPEVLVADGCPNCATALDTLTRALAEQQEAHRREGNEWVEAMFNTTTEMDRLRDTLTAAVREARAETWEEVRNDLRARAAVSGAHGKGLMTRYADYCDSIATSIRSAASRAADPTGEKP